MTTRPRRLVLNVVLQPFGQHDVAWRLPDSDPKRIFDGTLYQSNAQLAERGKLDAIFIADSPLLQDGVAGKALGRLEPIMMLQSIACVTKHIGLIATASTTFYEPYNLARLFSTLDHLSGGRAGWNIVTTVFSKAVAANFGQDDQPPDVRYARAEEFVEIVTSLWDSWEDDAIVGDKANGRFGDPTKIHKVEYAGKFLNVSGAFSAGRSPQGHPVLVQAGSSDTGRSFGAKWGEIIFTAHQTRGDAQAFYDDVKRLAVGFGRSADEILILPGISPFIAGTDEEARKVEYEFNSLSDPTLGLNFLEAQSGVKIDIADLDRVLDPDLFGEAGSVLNNTNSRRQLIANMVQRERPTARELIYRLAGARGQLVTSGTPEQLADLMVDWFENGAADGFNIMPPSQPGMLKVFVDEVVPLLQRRGVFHTDYKEGTLRDNLGLKRPVNKFLRTPQMT